MKHLGFLWITTNRCYHVDVEEFPIEPFFFRTVGDQSISQCSRQSEKWAATGSSAILWSMQIGIFSFNQNGSWLRFKHEDSWRSRHVAHGISHSLWYTVHFQVRSTTEKLGSFSVFLVVWKVFGWILFLGLDFKSFLLKWNHDHLRTISEHVCSLISVGKCFLLNLLCSS